MLDALDIGYAIKDQRLKLGLTQAQVAAAAGISKRCLWSLELGQNPGVQLDKLTAVLDALGLDLCIAERETQADAVRADKDETHAEKKPAIDSDAHMRSSTFNALAILTGEDRWDAKN